VITIRCTIDAKLHAHNKGSWLAKTAATKAARESGFILTKNELMTSPKIAGPVQLEIVFTVPNRRRRDLLNMAHSLKPYVDGVVDAGGIEDDSWEVLNRVMITVKLGDKLEADLIFKGVNHMDSENGISAAPVERLVTPRRGLFRVRKTSDYRE